MKVQLAETRDMKRAISIAVFIPAYNAAKTLGWVLKRIPQDAWDVVESVFVVDDGSTDETAATVEALSIAYPKVVLHSLPQNLGYGAAVRKGLELCLETATDYVVCLHADGQYPPEKMLEFVHYMHDNQVDILQGSRHKDGTALEGGMPLYKNIAGKCLTWLENRVFGLSLTDYHSGYMLYSRKAVANLPLEQLSHSFDFDVEVIAASRRRGLKIDEQGIPTHYGDEESHLNPISYGFRVLHVLWRYKRGHYDPR